MSDCNDHAGAEGVDDYGDTIGEIRSTSESFQLVVLVISLVVGFAASMLVAVPFSTVGCLIVSALVAGAICLVARRLPRFSTGIVVYERGMSINGRGEAHRIAYRQIEQYQVSSTEHFSRVAGKRVYVGTRSEFEILVAGKFKPIRTGVEFHRDKGTAQTLEQLRRRMCDAVMIRLSQELEVGGEIPFASHATLTLEGIRSTDERFGTERLLTFEEVESWRLTEQQEWAVTKKGEALPTLVLPTDGPNFEASAALFANMHRRFSEPDPSPVADPSPAAVLSPVTGEPTPVATPAG